jgi:hypothetical protein
MRSNVAALAIDSQYVILPLTGITTTRPGSEVLADGDTKEPRGKGSDVCFEGLGNAKVNVSGEAALIA